MVRAFPNCVNTWHHNFFPTGTRSRQDIPVLPTQTNRTCQGNNETQPKGNAAENPRVQVSELFFFYCAKCSTSYLAKCFLIRCHGSKKKFPILNKNVVLINVLFQAIDKEYKATLGEGLQTLGKALAKKGDLQADS